MSRTVSLSLGLRDGRSPIASLRSVTCRLGKTFAVRQVSFDLSCGERVALVGPNGSGKTTLLKTVAGLIRPMAGTVIVGGMTMNRAQVAARGIVGYAGHSPHIYRELTVAENLQFIAEMFLVHDPISKVDHLAHDLGIIPYRDTRTGDLSRGLQQRLALAIALLPNPRLVLLDEPEVALDASTRDKLAWIFDTHAEDSGVIFATHDLGSVSALAGRALVLKQGLLVGELAVRVDAEECLSERVALALARSSSNIPSGDSRVKEELDDWEEHSVIGLPARVEILKQIFTLFRKDLRLEWRSREVIPALTILSLLTAIVFSLAFVVPSDDLPAVAAGVLWASLVFGALLGGIRSFTAERDESTMEGLMLIPVLGAAIYLAKAGVNLIFLTVVGLITLIGVAVLFDVGLIRWEVVGTLLLGIAGFSSIASLYGAVTANVRARELLIPVLMLPVAIPILIAGVAATLSILEATSDASHFPWVGLLAGFSAIFVSLGALLFDHVLGE